MLTETVILREINIYTSYIVLYLHLQLKDVKSDNTAKEFQVNFCLYIGTTLNKIFTCVPIIKIMEKKVYKNTVHIYTG